MYSYTLNKPFYLFILFIFFAPLLSGQTRIDGLVRDPEGHPLAFVTVVVDGGQQEGVLTDIEGRFSLRPKNAVQTIDFRYVGFAPLQIRAGDWTAGQLLEVVLEPRDMDLPEAVVVAGENPADVLMRKVAARRDRNNPEKRRSYQCKTYNKIVFDLLPNRIAFDSLIAEKDTSKAYYRDVIKKFNGLERAMAAHHAFLMESVTERSYLRPDQVKERVLLNRVSGAGNAGIVALANAVQPFTFYGDYLQILDKDYVNPVSPGSPDLYFFHIEDTLYQGADTVWVLSFHPRQGKVFTALKGMLHIHSNNYAVQNVRARPAAPDKVDLLIEQSYRYWAEPRQWFPDQLNFELQILKYPDVYTGLRAAGRSYISEVAVEAPVRARDFDPERPLLIDDHAFSRLDSLWQPYRERAPLRAKELQTYSWLDQIGEKENFDRVFNILDYLTTGLVPIAGPLNVDLRKIIKFNNYENIRLGIGFSTAQPRPLGQTRRLEAAAYAGYGIRDKDWKYGGSALWRIHRAWQTQLSVGLRSDLLEPGALYELNQNNLVDRFLYARKADRVEEAWLRFGSRLWKGAEARVTLCRQDIRPNYEYVYRPETETEADRFRFAEAGVFFRYAPAEEVRRFMGSTAGNVQRLPVLEAAYSRGFDDLLDGDYNYERWTLALYQSTFIRRLGRLSWRLEAGLANGDAPAAKLFTLNQSPNGWNLGLFVVRNTFQSLPDTLLLSDRIVNFYLAQELGPVLYKSKHSAPFLILLQNASWGQLANPERHRLPGFGTPSETLLESGIQLDNLLLFNYVNAANLGVGGAVFYRWGGLQSEDWQKNISLRLSLRMNF
jgi:hypothetical protein